MIRLIIDSQAVTPRRSGIGEEVRRIVLALLEHYAADVDLFLYNGREILPARTADEAHHVWTTTGRTKMHDVSHQFRLPLLLARSRYDVFLTPDAIPPFLNIRVPMVAIINDTIPFSIPEHFAGTKKGRFLPVFRLATRLTVLRCRRIIVISRHTESDVIRLFRCPAGKIDRISLGGPDRSAAASRPDLPVSSGKYLLYVGRREPYKGIHLLLRAFDTTRRGIHEDVKLVLAGEPDPRHEPLYASIVESMEHGRDVINAGYVSDAELAWLYRHALALVHPSLYEGFGLPPLYAMSLGTPVVCSNRASLPEVVGDAALLVDPEDGPAFSSAIARVITDPGLRRTLAEAGVARSAMFDWKRTAEQVLESVSRAAAK